MNILTTILSSACICISMSSCGMNSSEPLNKDFVASKDTLRQVFVTNNKDYRIAMVKPNVGYPYPLICQRNGENLMPIDQEVYSISGHTEFKIVEVNNRSQIHRVRMSIPAVIVVEYSATHVVKGDLNRPVKLVDRE